MKMTKMGKMDISTLEPNDMVSNNAYLKDVMPYHITECEYNQTEDQLNCSVKV